MKQSTMAHEVAVPPLWAEPPSTTAIQETNSSKIVQGSLFYLELIHLA